MLTKKVMLKLIDGLRSKGADVTADDVLDLIETIVQGLPD